MQSKASKVVVLGTGGTIAGTASSANDNVGYTAGQVSAADLVQAIPALAEVALEIEQVAQVDSKDMSHGVWQALAVRCEHHLARAEVAGIVITHGTDTLEETAWFLQRVLAPAKPVVLTGAMRPSTAVQRDGPQNMIDAVTVVRAEGARGVVAVMAGVVHGARDVRKVHPYRIDAFSSGEAGPVGMVEESRLRMLRAWPDGAPWGASSLPGDVAEWPRVDIVVSHAGADGALVRALVDLGTRGIVVACTGNGTIHRDLEAALIEAQAAGVKVLRSTRTLDGSVIASADACLPSAGDLVPGKARVELLLGLM